MSEGANEGQEKSFDASETKIKKSREKGDIAQSTEANTFALYLALIIAIFLFGSSACLKSFNGLSAMLTHSDSLGQLTLVDKNTDPLNQFIGAIAFSVAPIFASLINLILISLIVQRAIVVAPEKLKPKLSRISPLSNAKQKYGADGLVEFLKRFAKLTIISVIAGLFFYQTFYDLAGLAAYDAYLLLHEMQRVAIRLTLYMLVAIGLITMIDLPYVQFSHLKKLRMTFQEIRDESKESEGDPQMKSSRRRRAQEISNSNMLRDVSSADVIIVNPTHYAVALKWVREKGEVPICVAKGTDDMAMRIREKATLHAVAIHSDPPCARAIHATVEIGEGIKPEHYAAVAAAIHFADSFRRKGY